MWSSRFLTSPNLCFKFRCDTVTCEVQSDDNKETFVLQQKALGQTLFYQVCESLNLIEVDYFGLEYHDHNGMAV